MLDHAPAFLGAMACVSLLLTMQETDCNIALMLCYTA